MDSNSSVVMLLSHFQAGQQYRKIVNHETLKSTAQDTKILYRMINKKKKIPIFDKEVASQRLFCQL